MDMCTSHLLTAVTDTHCLVRNIITSECWRGPATRYSFLICTIHGSDFGRRRGIESCRCPINPDFTSNGSSRPFKAVFFSGRLWRSTVPGRTNDDKLREHSAFSSTEPAILSAGTKNHHVIIIIVLIFFRLSADGTWVAFMIHRLLYIGAHYSLVILSADQKGNRPESQPQDSRMSLGHYI